MLFNSKIKYLILILVFSLSAIFSEAQIDSLSKKDSKSRSDKNQIPFKDRLFWGGTVGAWIGNPTFVDLSPLIGVQITEKFSIGVGAIYNYYSYKLNNFKYEASFYGGRVNARYFVLENVFGQVGWDRINRDNPYSKTPKARIWIDNILLGGGVRYQVSDNIYAVASGLWNINYSRLSPYPNPIIQIGFIGGF